MPQILMGRDGYMMMMMMMMMMKKKKKKRKNKQKSALRDANIDHGIQTQPLLPRPSLHVPCSVSLSSHFSPKSYTDIHTCMHACIQTYIHTYIHTMMCVCVKCPFGKLDIHIQYKHQAKCMAIIIPKIMNGKWASEDRDKYSIAHHL